MTDFIIVGRGLAANVLMHTFQQHQLSFHTFGNEQLSNCSRIAAGIWNPVVFKRLTRSWLADEIIPCLNQFYFDCESTLGKAVVTKRPIIKPFVEEQEKRLWKKKSITELNGFLDPEIYTHLPPELNHFKIANGFGLVNQCGNLNTSEFISLSNIVFNHNITTETFDHSLLKIFPDKVVYKNCEARHIVFCEGYLVKHNPFFNWVPLKPAKGEVLTIRSEQLKLTNSIFNKNGFLMDLGAGSYKLGATYEWTELTENTTEKGREELELKLHQMIGCDYSVIDHQAGVRPSSIDRRPIIGRHPNYQNLHIFNGLGTKGVMLAPFFAKNFVNFYLQKEGLVTDVQINRFYKLYGG